MRIPDRLIAIAALVPVAGAGVLVHSARSAETASVAPESWQVVSASSALACSGPIIPLGDDAHEVDVDPQFASDPPASAVRVDAAAVPEDSALTDGAAPSAGSGAESSSVSSLAAVTAPIMASDSSAGSEPTDLTSRTAPVGGSVSASTDTGTPLVLSASSTTSASELERAEAAASDASGSSEGSGSDGGSSDASGTDASGSDGSASDSSASGSAGGSLVSAVQTATTARGDYRGLVASSCAAPASTSYLVGARTDKGASSRLILSNPGTSSADVALRAYDGKGRVDLGGQSAVTVPAGSTTSILLGALAPDADALTIRVDSEGAGVSAQIQQQRLDGYTPAGIETIAPTSRPAERTVIGGLHMAAASVLEIALYAASDGATTATVTVRNAAGEAVGDPTQVDLAGAGTVMTELPRLRIGDYSLEVEADTPVAAEAFQTVQGSADDRGQVPADIAAYSAGGALEDATLLALPSDDLVLGLSSIEATAVTLVPVGGAQEGSPMALEVPEGGTVQVNRADLAEAGARDATAVMVVPDTAGVLRANLTLTSSLPDGVGIAGVAVDPAQSAGRSDGITTTG